MGEKVEQFKAYMARPLDLHMAAAVLDWDQEVYMPEEGINARAELLATLNTLAHELETADEVRYLLEAAEAEVAGMDYESDDASLIRVARRDYDQQTKIPAELVARESRATSKAFVAWRKAREEKNFTKFQPHLQEIVDINREKAGCLGYKEHPYDALLNLFETGVTTAQVESLFNELKAGLVPLLQEIAARPPVDDTFLVERTYAEDRQWELTLLVLRDMGYNFKRGRQDKAPHPFTTNFSSTDVRVTTRLSPTLPQAGLLGSVHEGGHALYEQGIPEKFNRTSLGGGATLGLHESQSRLWENQVALSRPFWTYYFPIMRAFFPDALHDISFDRFYRAINKVQPSFIRVEADEVTYNMHIFARFELEKDLLTGDLKVADVPEAWNAKYESYLGITPPDDAQGCLQDIHWSHGTIGYFPTYTLGTAISAQLYAGALQDIPDLEAGFTRAEFTPLLDWMRSKVHVHGRKFTAPELLRRELGQNISARPLLDYMRKKYTTLYEL
ncbi:MAG: carboxypeptidase M32 [Anaerolineae bacterium]|nr:carboxypeptidase M32 [Anaerolineae bacterium]